MTTDDLDADLLPYLADLSEEELAAALDKLPDHIVARLLTETDSTPAEIPADPLAQARTLDEGYRVRSHLTYLSDRLAEAVRDVEAGQTRYVVVQMPPRMGKSLLTSVHLPTWLLRRAPNWKIALISHSPNLATSWGREVRRMVEEHGPEMGLEIAEDAGAVSNWQTTKRGGVWSRSMPGQSITGLGFKAMLIDDPVKDFAAAHSPPQRDALWDWWRNNSFSRLEFPALVVVVGTRWHTDDLIGRLLSAEYDGDPDEWEQIRFPAIAEDADVLGRLPGAPLISPLLDETTEDSHARWDKIKAAIGTYAWSGLYQQRPAPARGAIFDSDWWRFWTTDPVRAEESNGRLIHFDPADPPANARWLDSWDMAFKGTASSDFVVGQRWCRAGPHRYLVHQERGRWSFTQSTAKMQAMVEDPELPGHAATHERLVEDKANGTAVIDVLKATISGLIPVNPTDSKEARARSITPECESGHVVLPDPAEPGHEWVADLLSELRSFPHDAHDDQVDALTQALRRLRDAGRGQITVPGRTGRTVDRSRSLLRPAGQRRITRAGGR